MLIDIHAHLLTSGMMRRHPFWGPFMKVGGFTVGHFSLGTKQPATAATDQEAEANLLARMTHAARRKLMAAPASAVKEIDRAVRQLGARGVCVGGANFNGLDQGLHYPRRGHGGIPAWEARRSQPLDGAGRP